MVRQLGDIVNDDAIRKYFQSLKGFSIRKDRILPHISTTAKFRRAKWAETFWLFWKSVKAVPTTKVRIVLNHMDEKWFYVVRCRTNYIVITSIGVEPNDYYAQHKNHIRKQTFIVVTSFVLNNNDIEKGGTTIPSCCVRAGKMVKASRDSYSTVYNDNGSSFTYPKVQEILLREKERSISKGWSLREAISGRKKTQRCLSWMSQ